MTIMCCAFEGKPSILPAYGRALAIHRSHERWAHLLKLFPDLPGARQIIELQVELVQTSCGTGVPLFDYVDDRATLNAWAERKGDDGIQNYWLDNNQQSIDRIPTEVARLNRVED